MRQPIPGFFCSVICFAIHGENVQPFRNPDITFTGILWAQQLWGQQQTVTVRAVIDPGLLWAEVSLVFAAHWKQEMWVTASRLPQLSPPLVLAQPLAVRAGLSSSFCSAVWVLLWRIFFFHWVKENKSGIEFYMRPEFSRYHGPFGPWLQQPECLWSLTEENIFLCSSMHRNYPRGSVFLGTLFINGLFFQVHLHF